MPRADVAYATPDTRHAQARCIYIMPACALPLRLMPMVTSRVADAWRYVDVDMLEVRRRQRQAMPAATHMPRCRIMRSLRRRRCL